MKAWCRVLAALTLALSLVLSSWLNGAQAEARALTDATSSSSSVSRVDSSSQALKDLHQDKKNPYKQVDSSTRKIPPSTSNPIQNKSNPPEG